MRTGLLAAAATVSAALVLAAGSEAAPATTYRALLATQFGLAELPHGFSDAQVIPATVTRNARLSKHVVGALQVRVEGPDPDDVILYAVYADAASAKYMFDHAVSPNSGFHVRFGGPVPGLTLPTGLYVGSGPDGYGDQVGVSIAAALVGNVLVSTLTDARTTGGGNTAGTEALLRAAVRHLVRLQESGALTA
jgi:hypothetical protein